MLMRSRPAPERPSTSAGGALVLLAAVVVMSLFAWLVRRLVVDRHDGGRDQAAPVVPDWALVVVQVVV